MGIDIFSDTLEFHATALGVTRACSASRQGRPLDSSQIAALTRAANLIQRAISGKRIIDTHRASATPTFDLEALDYAREAFRAVFPDSNEDQLITELRAMRAALRQTAEKRRFGGTGRWQRQQIEQAWEAIFWKSVEDASAPTDIFVTA
ncbi:MAG: hypothetical protein AABM40_04630 [Chloroflexota bacterium]